MIAATTVILSLWLNKILLISEFIMILRKADCSISGNSLRTVFEVCELTHW